MREVTVRTSSLKGTANADSRPTLKRTANARGRRPWGRALRLSAAALLLGVGVGGAAGCEFVTGVDRNEIPEEAGTTATGGGQGGLGGQGGAGGQGAQGGGGAGPTPCATPADCPGADDECRARTCEDGACGVHYAPANKLTSAQTASDCRRNVCDGQGNTVSVDDDLDVLVDGDPCSSDVCVAGTPANPPAPAATVCAAGGGHFCDGNGACVECLVGGDCTSGICMSSTCVAATCGDGVQNGEETDLDCGGPACVKCADLLSCGFGSDCQSGICKNGKCKVPACNDMVDNGQETDVDCGGPACPKCATGEGCSVNSDCLSDLCSGTTCLPSCSDLVKNGNETDVDCGGPQCPQCGTSKICLGPSDCVSGVCTAGHCAAPLCGDGVVNGADECDDQNSSNTDDCLNNCHLPTCGDGYVHAGFEPCDDGNASNTDACLVGCVPPTCGDGYVWFGVEACDDANTADGDGCSATCTLEGCGDGVVNGLELCDDGNLSNLDGCLNNCTPATCGDGYVYAGVEGCDDANATANDGCALLCTLEAGYTCAGAPSVCTSPAEINCSDGLDNDGDGSSDCGDPDCALGCNANVGPCAAGETELVYTSTDVPKPIPDLSVVMSNITVGGLGKVTRAVAQLDITHPYDADLDLYLRSPAGVNVELSTDNGSSNDNYVATIFNQACPGLITAGTAPYTGCYKPEGNLTTFNGGPAKGIWTLIAGDDLSGSVGTVTSWRLSLCVAASTCGDAVVDAGEVCDDGNSVNGDGCNGACAQEPGFTCAGSPTVCAPICGDGLVVGTEPCDDGNPANGDGCSAACAKEPGFYCVGSPSVCLHGDVEPNNNFADADARALDPVPTLITGDVLYGGSIPVVGDKDYYKITLAAASVVRFELFDSSAADCLGGLTTTLRLFNAAQTQTYTDNISGISSCSSIVVNLAAGTYYVEVEETGNNGLVPDYRLEVKVQATQGSEAEVNDTAPQANPLPGSNLWIYGGHQVNTDLDYYQITVPQNGMAVVAEIIEGGAETCESNGVDSWLVLYNAAGTELLHDDDDGRGYCSKIDGSGTTPLDANAKNLAAGTYYLMVRAADAAQSGVNGQFDYKLVVTIR
jgi:cysteine-rich repeat protein